MTDTTACPNGGELRGLLLGELSEADVVQLSEHLGDCPPCQTATQSLAAGDTLLKMVREAGR